MLMRMDLFIMNLLFTQDFLGQRQVPLIMTLNVLIDQFSVADGNNFTDQGNGFNQVDFSLVSHPFMAS